MLLYGFIAGISALSAAVCSFLFYPLVYFFHSVVIAPFKSVSKKGFEYKTVEANLRNGSLKPYTDGQNAYTAVYDYVVNGKQYSKVISKDAFNYFNNQIELYYTSDPKKAVDRIEYLGRIENPSKIRKGIWVVCFVIIFVALVIIWKSRSI